MGRRTVFAAGFAAGCWVAASAGPKVARSLAHTSVSQVAGKARAVVHLGIERVRQGREEAQILEFPRMPSAAAN